jgi:hypothetical protein
MLGFAIITAAAMRRVLSVASVAIAVSVGALAGLLVLGLPDAELAAEIFGGLLAVLAAILVLPLVAGMVTAERRGGYEQLVAMRPISSLKWTLGRVLGAGLGAATLVMLLAFTARLIGGSLDVPVLASGERMDAGLGAPTWRFSLQAGAQGPFELAFDALVTRPGGGLLTLELSRGNATLTLPPTRVLHRHTRVMLPDLHPNRGDLRVTLRAGDGVLLSRDAPQLTVGREALGRFGLPLPRGILLRLGFAALATLAAACAFHFETACLAGLLALAVNLPPDPWVWALTVGLLLLFATLGTALTRRAALP